MSIALEQVNTRPHLEHGAQNLLQMENEVRLRPNGSRVLRLLRELYYLDGRLASSIRHAGDFPLVTAALVALMVALVVAVENVPHAQSTPASASSLSSLPITVDTGAEQQAAAQALEYSRWLSQAHARAAEQGNTTPMPETF